MCYHISKYRVWIRIGEHDLSTDPDCDAEGLCAPRSLDILIQKLLPYPKYMSLARDRSYDIGIIKLSSDILYSGNSAHSHFKLFNYL